MCRYPVDGEGKPSMENARCFDLFAFAEATDAMLETLSIAPGAVSTMLDQALSP